ncbi:DUF3850 domain-containing protein [Scytonema sp. NUACC26]
MRNETQHLQAFVEFLEGFETTSCKREITYILKGEQWGIMPEYAILAIK